MNLLINSEVYKEALFKALKEVKVPKAVSKEVLICIVNSIFTMDQISFSPEELEEANGQHTKALFIVAKCMGKIISRVLIDNGSSLNVCPLATLHLLEIDPSNIKLSTTVVSAFNRSKRDT